MSALMVDTSAFTALLRGDAETLDAIAATERVLASVTAVVIGELEAGFRGGTRYRENRALLDRFLAKPTVEVLPVTRETGECFGRIKSNLRARGQPIPINDVWIAAQCMETGAVLLTFDTHFEAVHGLRLQR